MTAARDEQVLCFYRNLVHTCYREARHLGAPGQSQARLVVRDPELQAAMAKIRNWRDRLEDGSLFEKVVERTAPERIRQPWEEATGLTLDQLQELFARPGWSRSYGGPRWAAIVELTRRLGAALDAGNADAAAKICDEVAEVKHNSGRLVPRTPREQALRPTKWPKLCR